MKLRLPINNVNVNKICLGDVITIEDNGYLVVNNKGDYLLSLNELRGSIYDEEGYDIEQLRSAIYRDYIDKLNVGHYSRDEYSLRLVKI